MRFFRLKPALFLLVSLGLITAEARVYTLVGGKSFAESLGWSVAYSTTVSVNGVPAEVQVWGSPDSFHRSMAKLQEAWRARGKQEGFASGKTMGWGMVIEEDRVIRYLVVDVEGDQTMVYQTAQKLADYRKGDAVKGGAAKLEKVPSYPSARSLTHMRDAETGLEVEVTEVGVPAGQIESYFDLEMRHLGWGHELPVDGARIYTKAGERFYLTLKPQSLGSTLVTRVYKRNRSE